MIITITGKPCSGKGTVAKLICKNFNFEYICTGDMFRNFAKQYGYDNILEFQEKYDVKKIDKIVDDKTYEIGQTRIDEDIVIDSRMAWHFVPKSFKVFIDVDFETAGKRLVEANRSSEKTNNVNEAVKELKERWKIENERYMFLYGVDNKNLKNYDFVISSKDRTPEEIVDLIMNEYEKFTHKV